jgi:hypothetical protein
MSNKQNGSEAPVLLLTTSADLPEPTFLVSLAAVVADVLISNFTSFVSYSANE